MKNGITLISALLAITVISSNTAAAAPTKLAYASHHKAHVHKFVSANVHKRKHLHKQRVAAQLAVGTVDNPIQTDDQGRCTNC